MYLSEYFLFLYNIIYSLVCALYIKIYTLLNIQKMLYYTLEFIRNSEKLVEMGVFAQSKNEQKPFLCRNELVETVELVDISTHF